MKIEFEQSHLKELYEEGKAKKKKHRFQADVVRAYINSINKLKAAKNTEDLYPIKSLNFEALTNTNGLYSVRVNKQYRIEFRLREEGKEPKIITICSIVDLNNHYK